MGRQPVEVSIRAWKKNVVKPGRERGRVLLMPGTGYNCDRPLLYWSAQALVESGWRIDRMNVANASDDLSTVIPVINEAIDGWVASVRAAYAASLASDSVGTDVAATGGARVSSVSVGTDAARSGEARVSSDSVGSGVTRPGESRVPSDSVGTDAMMPPRSPRLLLIGKSLTTMTYPHVATRYGLPFVLLTPVLHHADFDPSARVIPVPRVGDDIIAESDAPSVDVAKAVLAADSSGVASDALAMGEAELERWRVSRYPGPAPLVCAGTADPFYDRVRANALTPHVHEYPDANHSIEVPGHWRRSLDYLKEVSASVAQYAATI
ncbi:hypothetical protein JS531_10390 [Bifidobacterium sp. CP2]|uniref:hypothetical protein n=1 Tax=Bifidobacterium sp. CP2 TaxID=2809025 RepID=UPI001BDC701E|nr:hypothetical protein [Bifidobacterium sp. CP2]MBT1182346.1 hypothetical protein [Bifidobacterium sp. CP2]